ncbi:MAG TPA: MFS transporter [Bacillota bacterium]
MSPWFALAVVTLLQVFASLAQLAYIPLGVSVQSDLDLSATQLGGLAAAVAAGGFLTAVASGLLIDRVGVRPVILLGPLTMALALVAIGWAPAYAPLLALLFVVGLGHGGITPLTSKAIADWFPGAHRGVAMGIKQSGVTLGGAIGAAVLPLIAGAWGWRYGFQAGGLALAVVTLLSYALYREAPQRPAVMTPAASGPNPRRDRTQPGMPGWRARWAGLRHPLLAPVIAAGFVFCGYQLAVQTFFMPYLIQELGLPKLVAAGYLTALQLAGVVGRPLVGLISDVLGRRLEVMAALGLCSGVGGMLLVALPEPSPWLLGTLTVLLGVSVFSWVGLFFTSITELVNPMQAGTVSGVGFMVNGAGAAAGPLLFGALLDATGDYGASMQVMGLAILCAAGVLALAPRRVATRKERPAF